MKLADYEECVDLLDEISADRDRNKLKDYCPYGLLPEHNTGSANWDWQLKFHNTLKHTRMLSTGNQQGKSFAGASEDAYHLTGQYPDWWEGAKFDHPVLLWACGSTSQKVRDSLQKYLIGNPKDADAFGTGLIPADCLDKNKTISRYQVAGAYESVRVKHVSGGWSTLVFLAYEQKKKAFMAEGVHVIHLDEEPSMDIYSSCVVRGVAVENAIVYITCTPESGLTELMMKFRNHLEDHQAYITATWADCPHLTPEKRKMILANIPAHERDMRSKGIPVIGSGVVYPIHDEDISVGRFDIPDYFKRIAGMDMGSWNHPTAIVWLAWDTDSDIVYVTDCYKEQERKPALHAAAMRAGSKKYVPVAWPHDAHKADRKSGVQIAQEYRDEYNCNMLHDHSTHPPADGQKEGEGGNSVNAGLLTIYNRMEEGRFKVFSHLSKWFEEKGTYHTKDGKIVAFNNDLMDATRYAIMMLRYAEAMRIKHKQVTSSELGYAPDIY